MIWIVLGALGVAAGAAIAWRLYPRTQAAAINTDSAAYDLEVYRDQLRELDRDAARGVIDTAEAEAARNEIRRRVLAADAQAGAQDGAASARALSPSTVLLIAVSVPVLSLSLYAVLGRPELADPNNLVVQQQQRGPTQEQMRAAAQMTPEQRREMIRGMVSRLSERMKENPKDLAGWLRLGRARSVLGEHEKSAEAYGKAAALVPKNVRVLTLYTMAVLRLRKNDGPIGPGLVALMKRLYDLEPRHPLALYYLGKNAFDLGREEEGKDYWRKLLPLLKDRPEFAARIRKRLEQGKE